MPNLKLGVCMHKDLTRNQQKPMLSCIASSCINISCGKLGPNSKNDTRYPLLLWTRCQLISLTSDFEGHVGGTNVLWTKGLCSMTMSTDTLFPCYSRTEDVTFENPDDLIFIHVYSILTNFASIVGCAVRIVVQGWRHGTKNDPTCRLQRCMSGDGRGGLARGRCLTSILWLGNVS